MTIRMSEDHWYTVPRGLAISTAIHSLLGQCWSMQYLAFNPLQPATLDFVNTSVTRHYGQYLDAASYAWLWACATVSFNVGAVIGSILCSQVLMERWGRRPTIMWWAQGWFILGCIMEWLSKFAGSFEMLILGRMLTGFGIFSGSFPVYVTECAPDNFRGKSWTLVNLGQYFWVLLSTGFALPQLLGNADSWNWYLLATIVPSFAYMACSYFLPESPKYLYITKGDTDAAEKSLEFYHGKDVDMAAVLDEFEQEARLNEERHILSLKQIWNDSNLRYPFVISLTAAVAQSFSGQAIYAVYSTSIFLSIGISQTTSVVLLVLFMFLKLVFGSAVGVLLIERVGRRPLLLSGMVFAFLGLVMSGASLLGTSISTWLGVGGFMMGLIGDILGLLSIPQLLIAELNPQVTRAQVSRLYFAVIQLGNCMQILCFPPLLEAIGGYAFSPVIIIFVIAGVVLWRYMPETRTLPVDQIVRRRAATRSMYAWTHTAHRPPLRSGTVSLDFGDERSPLIGGGFNGFEGEEAIKRRSKTMIG